MTRVEMTQRESEKTDGERSRHSTPVNIDDRSTMQFSSPFSITLIRLIRLCLYLCVFIHARLYTRLTSANGCILIEPPQWASSEFPKFGSRFHRTRIRLRKHVLDQKDSFPKLCRGQRRRFSKLEYHNLHCRSGRYISTLRICHDRRVIFDRSGMECPLNAEIKFAARNGPFLLGTKRPSLRSC